jgi:hypothetical protein
VWERYNKRRHELSETARNQVVAFFDMESEWGYCANHLRKAIEAMEK